MPTRKQRRRRAKDQRHEWEYVVVDEEGQEVEVKPSELRAKNGHPQPNGTPAKAKSSAAQKGSGKTRARTVRPAKPPSWRRAAIRAVLFAAALYVFTSFVGSSKNGAATGRLLIAVLYGLVAIPFFFLLDRATYNRYLKATGREKEIQPLRRRR
jgi:hypothetical protein